MFTYFNEAKNMTVPLTAWVMDIHDMEYKCFEQALLLTKHPKIYHHVALMPDCHVGVGMPIGGVIATHESIIPSAVGVDIGCGMAAVKTDLTDISTDSLKQIMGIIRETIPVGFNQHESAQSWKGFDNAPTHLSIIKENLKKAPYQLGTLGGGNHFIEIQKGDDGHIWFMIHSGSRNIGLKIANEYISIAKNICMKTCDHTPTDLAYIPKEHSAFEDYITAMNFALDFALENRQQMIVRIKKAFMTVLDVVHFEKEINIHHNYANLEHHFGKDVWVHRKGATLAKNGTIGIIPGSQGTGSYIVEGLGNPDSFSSCSHGAGRKYSRTAAKTNLDLEEQKKLMNDQNIIHGIRNVSDLDEAPGAYKDIDIVMGNQTDLVKPIVHLKPLAVIKG